MHLFFGLAIAQFFLKLPYLLLYVRIGHVLVRRNIELVRLFQLAVSAICKFFEGISVAAQQCFAERLEQCICILLKHRTSYFLG